MDDCRKRQTSTATPAEPGDLPWRLGRLSQFSPPSHRSHRPMHAARRDAPNSFTMARAFAVRHRQ